MTMWTYKIKTAVNSVVYYVPSIKAWFILQVSLVLLVNVVSYSLPTIQYKKKKHSYICLQLMASNISIQNNIPSSILGKLFQFLTATYSTFKYKFIKQDMLQCTLLKWCLNFQISLLVTEKRKWMLISPGLIGPHKEWDLQPDQKSTSTQAIAVLIKICFLFTGF